MVEQASFHVSVSSAFETLNETTESDDLIAEFHLINLDQRMISRLHLECALTTQTNFYSHVSSPESFCGSEFSPLSIIDSPESSSSHSLVDQEDTHTTNNTQDLQQKRGNNSIKQNSNQVKGVKIVGDNTDKSVKPRFMRSDHHNKSLHYFHCYAVRDQFDLSMRDEYPDIPDQPKLEDLLPSESDISKMKAYFTIHVARIL